MKFYTAEEKEVARQKLPRPVRDFLGSPALVNIYLGMKKKLKLDMRQLMAVTEITHTALMGLEPESALETNLHQVLHELSNVQTKELVADINDRIFKEAKRRLAENITEPEQSVSPAFKYNEPMSDEDLLKAAEEERQTDTLIIQQDTDLKRIAEIEEKTGKKILGDLELEKRRAEEDAEEAKLVEQEKKSAEQVGTTTKKTALDRGVGEQSTAVTSPPSSLPQGTVSSVLSSAPQPLAGTPDFTTFPATTPLQTPSPTQPSSVSAPVKTAPGDTASNSTSSTPPEPKTAPSKPDPYRESLD